ncbi:hypothetical protein [Rhizobium mesosinicum]|uniref:Uncharacterized protein n=1 Tax=Rhizobium mesosinicum TaxID=335017 RepID=A0ABS7H1J9_9HYPH|nr:hypothetical protein [Rhizobium mesosinicum]MBW9055997.1 hypothetical protein [Rhizobium mesosinicum]
MNNPKPVAFLFAYVPQMPASVNELSRIGALRTQSAILLQYARKMGLEPPDRLPAVTTYRGATFTRNPTFENAVARAQSSGTTLWVAHIWELLRKTKPANASKALEDLDNLKIDVLDCLSGKNWKEFGPTERVLLVREAWSRAVSSAVSSSSGAARKGQAPDIHNALKGASANKTKAQRRAEQLRPVVDALKSSLSPDQALTPSMLMRHLNAESIAPERGNSWSLNSCKNLLNRLRATIK